MRFPGVIKLATIAFLLVVVLSDWAQSVSASTTETQNARVGQPAAVKRSVKKKVESASKVAPAKPAAVKSGSKAKEGAALVQSAPASSAVGSASGKAAVQGFTSAASGKTLQIERPLQPAAVMQSQAPFAAPMQLNQAGVQLKVEKPAPAFELHLRPPSVQGQQSAETSIRVDQALKPAELPTTTVGPVEGQSAPASGGDNASVPPAVPVVPAQPFNVGGTVQSISAEERTLTMAVESGGRTIRDLGSPVTMQVPAGAKIVLRSQPQGFEVITPGMGVIVAGDRQDQSLTAKSVVVVKAAALAPASNAGGGFLEKLFTKKKR